MNVYEKLQHVQANLNVPKQQYNKFGQYYYRSCEEIQNAAKPLLEKVKAALIVDDDIVLIGDRYYVMATATFIDCESGETVKNSAYAREEFEKKGMDASQLTGSTSSYARKYALNGLFSIDDSKDADSKGRISEDQFNGIVEELRRTGVGAKNLGKEYGITDIHDMTTDQYESAMKVLNKKPTQPGYKPATPEEMQQFSSGAENENGLPFK